MEFAFGIHGALSFGVFVEDTSHDQSTSMILNKLPKHKDSATSKQSASSQTD